jgi:hypothetical protein
VKQYPIAPGRRARSVEPADKARGGAIGYQAGGAPDDDGPVFDPTRLPAKPPPVFDRTRLAKPGGMSWGDVASGAIDNAPESAKEPRARRGAIDHASDRNRWR